jgi:hypothetical protein
MRVRKDEGAFIDGRRPLSRSRNRPALNLTSVIESSMNQPPVSAVAMIASLRWIGLPSVLICDGPFRFALPIARAPEAQACAAAQEAVAEPP